MRIMACDAGFEWIVDDHIDLWKSGGPRGVVFMTQGAELPLSRREWLRRERIVGMHRRRSMTRFAREILMKALFLHAVNIFVAPPTDGRACEFDFFRNFPLDGRRAMQLGFDKRGRQDQRSEDKNPSNDDGKDNSEPSYLLRYSFEHSLYFLFHAWI